VGLEAPGTVVAVLVVLDELALLPPPPKPKREVATLAGTPWLSRQLTNWLLPASVVVDPEAAGLAEEPPQAAMTAAAPSSPNVRRTSRNIAGKSSAKS
jgi:hypothetical protein